MITGNDMEMFMDFYGESSRRIKDKISAYNEDLKKEENPLLRPFFYDLADLNSGGKLLRGVFVNLGYKFARELAGDNDFDISKSDGLSMAFEMFQTGVLIHDDIIDHADLRRGKATIHKRYEKAIKEREMRDRAGDTPKSAAICTGDLGLYLANNIIAREYASDPELGNLIGYFDEVVINTIRGELLDVILPCEITSSSLGKGELYTDTGKEQKENEAKAGAAADMLRRSVEEIYSLKTAKYSILGPLHLGMILGNATEEQMRDVDECAEQLGIAFQIKDDILGIFGDEENIGKSVGGDISEAKLTILYQHVACCENEALEELLKYYGKPEVTAEDVKAVRRIFTGTGALSFAENAMKECFEKAEKTLAESTALLEPQKAMLRGIGGYFLNRKK